MEPMHNTDEILTVFNQSLDYMSECQAKSMFDTAGIVSNPDMNIATLHVHRKEREQLARMAEMISDCHRQQQGFSMLLDSRDIETGRLCIEAILSEAGFIMRRFSDEDIFRQDRGTKGNSLFDPLSQEQISVMDYVFANREGIQQASVILDIAGEFRRYLAEIDEPGDSTFNFFLERVEQSTGILFFVTSLEGKSRVSLAFSYSMTLGYPREEQQMRCWEGKFQAFSEDELVKLVERYPMHLAEIQMVADRIITAARIEDADTDAISLSRIEKFIARLMNRRTVPLLFGMS